MKQILNSLVKLSTILLFFFPSCMEKEDELTQKQQGNQIRIQAVSQTFNPIKVTTRADHKNEDESKITSLHLFIFDAEGEFLSCYEDHFQSYQFIRNGVFTINRDQFSDQTKAANATVCIVGNVAESEFELGTSFGKIANLKALRNHVLASDGIKIPEKGLVLYGESQVDLSSSNQAAAIFQVNVKSLYARVDLNITLEPEEADENLPSFTITSYDICNLPQGVRIGDTKGETIGTGIRLTDQKGLSISGINTITSGKTVSFSFYMPEHKCEPAREEPPGGYPAGITENEKQRYKPALAKDSAAYVLFRGIYTDMHGMTYRVAYKVYLGANHTNDFKVVRNCQYRNNIAILGISRHNGNQNEDGTLNLAVDMRVDVEYDQFVVSVVRELQLDSHIEVRPMDILLFEPNAKMELEIMDSEQNNWFRFEQKASAGILEDQFCVDGRRKYFTIDLLSNTLKNSTKLTLTNKTNRVWFYFDENLDNPSVDGFREGVVRLSYFKNQSDQAPTQVINYRFNQRALCPVTYEGRTYYIEHYEEYLYNFNSDGREDHVVDGLPWGLDGKQISKEVLSITIDGTWLDDVFNKYVIPAVKPFYDFDNTFNGLSYTRKIVTEANTLVLPLDQSPRNGAEYCYNKNKRNSDGSIAEMNWYMPAISELEDIASGAYTIFGEFQDKYYWASQPASKNFTYICETPETLARGYYRTDNTGFARATKVKYENGKYSTVDSDVENAAVLNRITWDGFQIFTREEPTGIEPVYGAGYQPRNRLNRIRAVRKFIN